MGKWPRTSEQHSIDEIAAFFGITRDDLLADRETETIIVEKNSKLSKQKKWLIVLISFVMALVVATVAIASVLLTRRTVDDEEVNFGGGEVEILGISAHLNAPHETLEGDNRLSVYRLQAGETYELYVNYIHRGSRDVRLPKVNVEIYCNAELLSFDEGDYMEEPDRDNTSTFDHPFYITCLGTAGFTKILATTEEYWCSVAVIVDN